MNKELIIDVTPNEITIALLENRQLVELNREKCKTGFAVGDIYLGRVRKIMPGLNAAFVDIGHERDAFIHYYDLGPQFSAMHRLAGGLINNRRLPRFPNLQMSKPLGKQGKIGDQVATGHSIIVQIAKEAISTKGPRLTSEISLAGRNVVLIPFADKVSLSKQIRSNQERKRLKKIVESILPRNYGVIVRTAAVGKDETELAADINELILKWEGALKNARRQKAPMRLLSEMNRATTIIRDLLNGSFTAIHVNEQSMYNEIREYIKQIAPEKENIVREYKRRRPIFEHFKIARQIKSLFSKYVTLRRGAYLIIESTEAMNVIDVNSGNRAKVGDDQERTALNVNLAAAEEIARQLRLRDMGGIIVIDFIDMHRNENRQTLHNKMKEFMANDRAKHTILPITRFGLMQITRQRVRPEAIAEVSEKCPSCKGTGEITPTVNLDEQIENQMSYHISEKSLSSIKLVVSPFVAAYLKRGFIPLKWRWMWRHKCRIKVKTDPLTGFVEVKFFDNKGKELK